MVHRHFKIFNSANEPIRGDVSVPNENKRFPVVIVAHGFKGFKDWGFFPYLAKGLCRKGFIVVKFNFSGSGIGEDLEVVADEDLEATDPTFDESDSEEANEDLFEEPGTDLSANDADPESRS